MPPATKILLLRNISFALQSVGPEGRGDHITIDWLGQEHLLPEVTIRIPEWLLYCPAPHRARVADVSATMTDRMAVWVERNWKINSEDDLNVYCFAVAGAVCMLFLSDIWEWFDGIRVDRGLAVAYGRAFQSVNILKNIAEDAERGVSFYPPGWTQKDVLYPPFR
jgi:farnesyl-diphosphate farnesyltransferase